MSTTEETALCGCGPGERCFDCATDEEMGAAVPPWPSMGGGPRLTFPGCGSKHVDLRRAPFCGTCAATISEEAGSGGH